MKNLKRSLVALALAVLVAPGAFAQVSPGNPAAGMDSAGNHTTELAAGATFTGEREDVSKWGVVIVTAHSDVASAVDGLAIQFSDDGSDWHTTDSYTIIAGSLKTFTIHEVPFYTGLTLAITGANSTVTTIYE